MREHRFDGLSSAFGTAVSRRHALAWSFLGALPLFGRDPESSAAKGRRRTRPKIRRNAFGCVSVGDFCKSNVQCCSGLCQGKKGRRRCRARVPAGTCNQEVPSVCQSANPITTACNNRKDCACIETTGESSVCAELFCGRPGCSECANCRSDADCLALGFPPEASCAAVTQGLCAGVCETGMACILPCGPEPPPPAA